MEDHIRIVVNTKDEVEGIRDNFIRSKEKEAGRGEPSGFAFGYAGQVCPP
jgi:hypothetical protein